jgi:hypothetical protein
MPKMLTLVFALLCATAVLQAQNSTQQDPATGSAQTGASTQMSGSNQTGAASQTSVQGCLQGSNGSYTITDANGTTYQVQGDNAKLSKHVGHQVEITGTTSGSSASSTGETSTGAGAQQTLTVTKVKHMSGSCSNNMSK